MNKLLKQQFGFLTWEGPIEIQPDHAGYPFSIRRHPVDRLTELRADNTESSLMGPLNFAMWISSANPCENPEEKRRLMAAESPGPARP